MPICLYTSSLFLSTVPGFASIVILIFGCKLKLDFTETKAISNELLDRIAEIEIHKGGVLVVQSKERNDE